MSAKILKFQNPSLRTIHEQSQKSCVSFAVEIPTNLAQRIAGDTTWNAKSPKDFVLQMLEASFLKKEVRLEP